MKPMTRATIADVAQAKEILEHFGVSVFDLMLADCVERYVASNSFVHRDLATERLFDTVKVSLVSQRSAANATGLASVTERQIDAALNGVFDALTALIAVTHQRAGHI